MVAAAGTPIAAQNLPSRPTLVVGVLTFAGIVVALMQTVVIPLVPMLPELLGATPSSTVWVVTATLLAASVATPTTGRLGDMVGKRRMMLVSIALLVVGSVVVAMGNSLLPTIIGRALQGLAAGVIPLGISIMRDELAPERVPGATALMSSSLGVGGALGLPASTLLAQETDWHVLFWASAVLGLVSGVLVYWLVPESSLRTGGRLDGVGVVGLTVGLLALLLAVPIGAQHGWGHWLTLGLLGVGVVVMAAWARWELSRAEPLVDLRTFASRTLLLTNSSALLSGFSIFAVAMILPTLLQLPEATGHGFGRSMLVAGLVMAPSGVVMIAMAPVAARIINSRGARVTLMVGGLVVGVGYTLLLVLMSQLWMVVVATLFIGAGNGILNGAMPSLVMGAVPRTQTASANGVNTLLRSIGMSLASAVAGAVLASLTIGFGLLTVPSQAAFQVVLAIGAVSAIATVVVAFLIPRPRPR